MTMTRALAQTLAMIAEAASGATGDWWIIGSAAVVLHGRRVAHVNDVDLMMSAHDAEQFLNRVGGHARAADAHKKFRSLVFGVWTEPPVPVEIFGGFSLAGPSGWREVSMASRESVDVGGHRLFVPSVEELARLLRAFGRPKDLERARILQG